jgi:hypothetical protein
MKYLLLLPLLCLASCDTRDVIIREGHTYILKPQLHTHYEHDPQCPACHRMPQDAL